MLVDKSDNQSSVNVAEKVVEEKQLSHAAEILGEKNSFAVKILKITRGGLVECSFTSKEAINKLSVITVRVDDKPIISIKLSPTESLVSRNFDFYLPINYLDEREHQFKFIWSDDLESITMGHTVPHAGVGRVDRYHNGYVEGWALADGHFGVPTSVDIYIDNIFFTTARADTRRADLLKYGLGKGNNGFKVFLPLLFEPERTFKIDAYFSGTKTKLSDKSSIVAEGIQEPGEEALFQAQIADFQPGGVVSGWAIDYANCDRNLKLQIIVDGDLTTVVEATELYPEAAAQSLGEVPREFRSRLPSTLLDDQQHHFEIILLDEQQSPTQSVKMNLVIPSAKIDRLDSGDNNSLEGSHQLSSDFIIEILKFAPGGIVQCTFACQQNIDKQTKLKVIIDEQQVAIIELDKNESRTSQNFDFFLPITLLDKQEHKFEFIWSENLNSSEMVALIPRISVGRLDAYKNGYIQGWALPEGYFHDFVSVDIYINDIFFTEVQADAGRYDLLQYGLGNGQNGFKVLLPLPVEPNKTLKIDAYFSGTKIQLGEKSSITVDCPQSPQQNILDTEKRLKGAVVSWDMSHNPAGRSFLLADIAKVHFDIELIGPIFTFYGKNIWSPLQGQDMEMNVFTTLDFTGFVKGAIKLARAKKYDFVYVSKARFPSLFIGMLIKYYSKCPLILDVDDHELSFFKNKPLAEFAELLESPRNEEWYKPYSEIWTRFTESLIPTADALTVSNIALQERFGGKIVRHARDENIFDPKLYNRTDIRSQFGYQEQDKVILFLGTPRPHKGIFHLAEALHNIEDPSLVLCVIGTIDEPEVAEKFLQYNNARIDFHDNQPWERLPELVLMADLICILQDPKSPIADYQIPAKLTDAMAMGVPTMVTKVPPLQDLIESKSVIAVDRDNLETEIVNFFENENSDIIQHASKRYTYLNEFTYGVNSERIKQTLAKAQKNFKPFFRIYDEIFQLIGREYGIEIPEWESLKPFSSSLPSKTTITIAKDEPFNILFFWKQNDSDLYARRQDMIAKYFAKSDRINKVIHFDAPISAEKLQGMVQHGSQAKFNQNNLVFTNTVERFLGLKDTHKIIKRTFVYRDKNSGEKFLGKTLPQKSDYPNFVRQVIKEAGIGRNTIAWVCPVSFEFPELHQELKFGCVIADIIDDQRQWDVKPQYLAKLSQNYRQILQSADMAFTNCQSVKQSFQDLNSQIDVVPNGSELFTQLDNWEKPEFLVGLKGPIIGYVGNLSDRIDIELLEYIAIKNPDWNIVMIGSAHGSAKILELLKYTNVHLLGVKPYDEAAKFIRYFDVAMVPHIHNKLTKNMNCLKLYVYFAIGVPIVTTEIANIDEFAGSIHIAKDKEDFERGIKNALSDRALNPDSQKRRQLLDKIDWQNRVDTILARLNRYFEENNLSGDSNQFALQDNVGYSPTKDAAKYDTSNLAAAKKKPTE